MWQRFSQLLACYCQSVCVFFRGGQAHEYNLVSYRPEAAVPEQLLISYKHPTNPLKKDFTLIPGVPANGSPTPPVNVLHFM